MADFAELTIIFIDIYIYISFETLFSWKDTGFGKYVKRMVQKKVKKENLSFYYETLFIKLTICTQPFSQLATFIKISLFYS